MMADEKEQYNETQEDKDFLDGFAAPDAPPAEVTQKADDSAVKDPVADAPATDDATAAAAAAAVKDAQPEFVQLTKADFERLSAAADKTADFDAKFSKLFGTTGDLKQLVTDLQASTAKGATIEIPEDAFADLAEDYPDVAARFKTGLEKTLKTLKGTSTTADAKLDPEMVDKLVKQTVQRHQAAALEDEHPGWRSIVGTVDADGKPDMTNPFRQWLAKQSTEYRTRIEGTDNAAVISKAISTFKEVTKAKSAVPAPKVAARKDRIASAVQPKSSGTSPAPSTPSEDDAFAEGFAAR